MVQHSLLPVQLNCKKTKELAELDISILLLRYHNDICHMMKDKSYQDELDYIVTYRDPRNKFISKVALDQTGNTLVMFQFVEKHGKVLYDMIKGLAPEGRKVFYVSGEVDASDREQIRGIVEKENDAIVASLGTFSTGINIRNLHNIVFATPSKSQVKVLQSIGRGPFVSLTTVGVLSLLISLTISMSNLIRILP